MRKIFLGLASLLFAMTACANVATLNLVTPNDPGAKRAAHNISYGTEDRQTLDVYVPKTLASEKADTPKPVMIFIYGGSWRNGAKKDYSFVGHAFASRGYVTVLIDYRLVPEVVYPAFVEDAAAGFKWVHDNIVNYNGDPDQIFISGHSAGAYNAVMLGLEPAFLAVHNLSPQNIKGIVGLAGPYDFYPFDAESTIAAFGAAANPLKTQPVKLVTAQAPPMLLTTGTADTTVKPRNTKALAALLEAEGIYVETKYYDGLDHAETLMALSRRYRDKAPELEDIVSFMETVLTTAP